MCCPRYGLCAWHLDFRNHTKLEGIQNRAQRVFLGVHTYPPLLCLVGDTGLMKTNLNMLRYWNRLIKMHFDRLPKRIFVWEYMNAKNNWCSELKYIFSRMDLPFLFENVMACNIDLAKRQLFEVEETEWRDEISKKPKLRLYRQIKSHRSTENYLQMDISRLEGSLFSQIRFGIVPIEIEVGRYRQKPVEERFCYHCKDEIEDELYFLFYCKAYKILRNNLP